jgi:hypothetical protein
MSNGFIYVVDAHFIDKIEKKKILDPSACVRTVLIDDIRPIIAYLLNST